MHELQKIGDAPTTSETVELLFTTKFGKIYRGDSKVILKEHVKEGAVDLIMTSPPFALLKKKAYGNVDANEYLDWFRPFGELFHRVLKPTGSLVIDIGSAWIPGQPTKSLYHYKLLIMLCEEIGFHLAQDFFWWNSSKLPTPATWVTVRRVRVKDAIDCIWWLSKTPLPKASNRRVLAPYSDWMQEFLKSDRVVKKRQSPSGHKVSEKITRDNGASIPPNLLPFPNSVSNSYYLRYCKEKNLTPHPARYPAELPEYFIRMLTDPGDMVVDPFAGSCVTGEVAERLNRQWVCCELVKEYLLGAKGRFEQPNGSRTKTTTRSSYSISNVACLWNGIADDPLPEDGGKEWSGSKKASAKKRPRD